MKKSEVPEKWRHMREQTLRVLKARDWYDPRQDKYGSLTPPEQGLNGKIYTSIAYGFEWADEAAAVFQGMPGYAYPRLPYGTPSVQELGKRILDRVARLSESYGTRVDQLDGKGIIRLV